MNNEKLHQFWNTQQNSRHRYDTPEYYAAKAEEHAALFAYEDRTRSVVDIGCGAGELLSCIAPKINVKYGLDYAESMLAEARVRLASTDIQLVNADLFEFLPAATVEVWMMCGAINQYFTAQQLEKFLDLFVANAHVRACYLFDCVDPIRYALWPYGLSYSETASRAGKKNGVYRRVRAAAGSIVRGLKAVRVVANVVAGGRKPERRLPGLLGYGYLPQFWLSVCDARQLSVQIVSSRFYEYRYHVLIRKTGR